MAQITGENQLKITSSIKRPKRLSAEMEADPSLASGVSVGPEIAPKTKSQRSGGPRSALANLTNTLPNNQSKSAGKGTSRSKTDGSETKKRPSSGGPKVKKVEEPAAMEPLFGLSRGKPPPTAEELALQSITAPFSLISDPTKAKENMPPLDSTAFESGVEKMDESVDEGPFASTQSATTAPLIPPITTSGATSSMETLTLARLDAPRRAEARPEVADTEVIDPYDPHDPTTRMRGSLEEHVFSPLPPDIKAKATDRLRPEDEDETLGVRPKSEDSSDEGDEGKEAGGDGKMTDRAEGGSEGHPHSQGILSWHDPLNQYSETIYAELRQNELKYRPRADYMETVQKDINHTMRGILVDWLVEVGEEYKLCSQTLFLTVRYIDRLLSVVSVHRTKLQLVGITCMLLASKYEEIYPPSVDDFVYISDNTYSRDEVLRMETVLLNSLKFALTNATCWEFARRFSAACGLDKRTTALVNYMTEAFLQEPSYLKFLPSQVGAAAVFLALVTTRQKPWSKKLERASLYSLAEIRDAVTALHQTMLRLHQGQCTLKAVKHKYSEPKLHRVALIVPPTELI